MIVSKLKGGLGNQLFQWSCGKGYSLKYNTPLYLDSSFYQNQIGVTERKFSLDKFTNLGLQIIDNITNVSLKIISEGHLYKELDYNKNNNYLLDGYWQSEKYFKESEDIIREELQPDKVTLDKLNKIPFINKNIVSIHIRRTDYVTSNGYHPVQKIEYYRSALMEIGNYDYIFVFSDDIQWCKDNLTFDNMIFIEGLDDVEDLWLMSMCKNNIIANSSFSWWGAWLNNNPNKKVIAPTNWFGGDFVGNIDDLLPSEWIKI